MFGPVPADVIGQPTAGEAQPGGAATEAGTAAAAGQQQDAETVAPTVDKQKASQKQERGPFGPILTQYRHDAQGAIKALTELQDGEAVAALQHPEVGDIDLVWGEAGTGNKDGYGLSKLVKFHSEVVGDLQGFLSRLSVDPKRSGKNRIRLADESGEASVSLDWKGDSKVWLLTAYEKDAAAGTTMNTASNDAKGDTTRLDGGTAASVPAQGADANPDILYSKSAKPVANPTAVKLRRAMVQRTVDALDKGWAKAPNVTVVDSMQDERVPEAVRKADAAQRSQGAMGEPEGFWYRGQVYLVASALPTSADAARVLYHEVLGHHGLRGHFGKDLDRVLDQVIKLRRKDVQAKAQEYGLDMDDPKHAGYAAEEVLAELAQSRPDLGFVQRAIAAIRNFLRTHVPGFKVLELTDADIVQGYLLPARGWVERGADAGSAADGSMFSRSGGPDTEAQRQFKATERAYGGKAAYDRAKAAGKTKLNYGQWVQVRTPNFKAWFGDWETVRAQELSISVQ